MTERAQRRLAAIVSTDVVGYSRLMGADEASTLSRMKAHRQELWTPEIEKYGGRVVGTAGDSQLVEFTSAVSAVECSLAVQQGMAEREASQPDDKRMLLRVGINIGEVVVDGDDIYGDGVNVAARLQAIAPAGGICLSGKVHDEIDGKVDARFEDAGLQEVKNIARSVQVWRWNVGEAATPEALPAPLGLPDKPSVAVLPFLSLSSDQEQAYFADGIVEDLITALSRFSWLFIIARNSSFSYKGKNVPVRQVARELGVRYVVEGSVRSSPSRLRVTVQLIDASNDRHIWAENYDRPAGDLFDLQDEIVQSITGVLVPALGGAERERSLRSSRPSLDAWEAYQRGLAHYYRPYSDEDHAAARQFFDKSTELDPDFADAYAMIAFMGVYAVYSGQSSYAASPQDVLAEAQRAAQRAVQLDDRNALAHAALGRTYQLAELFDLAIAECETAVRLNPNMALLHYEFGFVLMQAQRFEDAIACFDTAIRLSPNDPSRWNFYLIKALAQFGSGDFETAIINAREAARLRPAAFWPHIFEAGPLAALGRMQEANVAIKQALARMPDCTASFLSSLGAHGTGAHFFRLIETLREAGLPE